MHEQQFESRTRGNEEKREGVLPQPGIHPVLYSERLELSVLDRPVRCHWKYCDPALDCGRRAFRLVAGSWNWRRWPSGTV